MRVIKLARPPVNALNGELMRKLVAGYRAAARDRGDRHRRAARPVFRRLDVPSCWRSIAKALAAVFVELWRAAARHRHVTRAHRVRHHRALPGGRHGARHPRRLPRHGAGRLPHSGSTKCRWVCFREA